MIKYVFPIFLFILAGITPMSAQNLPLSTNSDSARYYYYQGWENVMDLGHYSHSAIAFKKCVEQDPTFLIGQCLYGRISEDLAEQEEIYALGQRTQQSILLLLLFVFFLLLLLLLFFLLFAVGIGESVMRISNILVLKAVC